MSGYAVGPGELLAELPHMIGYQPDPDSLVVIGLRGSRAVIIAVSPLDRSRPLADDVHALCGEVAPALATTGVDTTLLVHYGGRRSIDPQLVMETVVTTLGTRPVMFNVDGEMWSRTHPIDGGWLPDEPLPPAPMLLGSTPNPEGGGRDAFYAGFQPHPEPGYRPLSAPLAAELRGLAPSLRVMVAQRALEQLSFSDPPDPNRMAVLAQVILDSPELSHHITHEALVNRDRGDALIETFRNAPLEHRADLADLAAVVVWMSGRGSKLVEGILEHGHIGTPMHNLVRHGIQVGVDPSTLRAELDRVVVGELTELDQQWDNRPSPTVDPVGPERVRPRPGRRPDDPTPLRPPSWVTGPNHDR